MNVPPSRYKQSRILVRRLCRLPGEDKSAFKGKLARLRVHFQRFNIDASDLCQWLMSLRPKEAESLGFPALWSFLLEPALEGIETDELTRDRWRLAVFDELAGLGSAAAFLPSVPAELAKEIAQLAPAPKTQTAQRLFERLRALNTAHRLVLLKAAAEWVVARYLRGATNWRRQHEEWVKEKDEWEKSHPELTPERRDAFTRVFRNLVDPERDGAKGLRRKNPRICLHQRLKEDKDNCAYGEKGHGPLCWKYNQFVKEMTAQKNVAFRENYFPENAERYLKVRVGLEKPEVKRKLKFSPRQEAFARLYQQPGMSDAKFWFTDAWAAYLKFLGLSEATVVEKGRLPHCLKLGGLGQESRCEWNPHTELCKRYKAALAELPPETLTHEADYRVWRRSYLAGPRKPSFRYPSAKTLPMPKIFGAGFHEIDFARSVLRLRLNDMAQGEWLEFGFMPWPRGYRLSKAEVKVTSVHVFFHGRRPRAGFRFEAPHRPSRFGCPQDELEKLRSQDFPRQAHDKQFLAAARERLLKSFAGDPEQDLRLLAVDLGETGAAAALYHGRRWNRDLPLAIVKLDQRYSSFPATLKCDEERRPPRLFKAESGRGLSKEHVGRHLAQMAESARRVAEHRLGNEGAVQAALRAADLRGLSRHVRWMLRDWARHNAAQIVAAAEECQADLIAFESLRGFRPKGYEELDFAQKRRLAFFAYGQVRRKVVEKAVERGMRVVTLPYGFSSRLCSACGHEQKNRGRCGKNKKERKFDCECGAPKKGKEAPTALSATTSQGCACAVKLDSDVNAARLLARVFWGEIELPDRAEAEKS